MPSGVTVAPSWVIGASSTLPLVGRVANEVSGVGVGAGKALYEHPQPDPLRGSTLPTRARVKTSPPSSNHARLVAPGVALDPGDIIGSRDQVGERLLRVEIMPRSVRLVALDVYAQRSTRRAGAGQTKHDTR